MSSKSKTQETPAETVGAVTDLGRALYEGAMKTGAEAAVQGYRNLASIAAAQMRIAKASGAFGAEDANVSAFAASSEAIADGVQAYMAKMISYTQSATAENIASVERTLGAKSPQQWLEAQAEASGQLVGRVVAQTTELNRIVADTATRAVAPVVARGEQAARDA